MIPFLSHVLMILAVVCAALGFLTGVASSRHEHSKWAPLFPAFFNGMLGFVWFSVALLVYAFLMHDFSLRIVFEHVQTNLPWYYKLGAIWAGHEGSIVLWLFVLTLWSAAYRSLSPPSYYKTVCLTVLITIHLALLLYILLASSPFDVITPIVPTEGQDLNPLLQDLGMMFHPPVLYVGYVGFAVPFAMVLAAMITKNNHAIEGGLFEKVVLTAWGFLTVGITLGSFWAYYELGWGGFWFWDPVENASLLPWLVATALVHALQMPHDSRHLSSVYLLTMWAFILSLLGTFLVRSGLLSSVHSFASDPKRGFFILMIVLFFVMVGHYFYFKHQPSKQKSLPSLTSRESFLTLNQIAFVIIASIVFLGTVYPLIIEAMGLGFISVGPQYFNQILLPIGTVVAVLMGMSASSRYRQSLSLKPQMVMMAIALSAFLWPLPFQIWARVGLALFIWVVLQTGYDLSKNAVTIKRVSMHLAHMGFAVFILGIAISQTMGVEQERRLSPGDHFAMAGSSVQLNRFDDVFGPNYEGVRATLWVSTPGHEPMILKPEKRYYTFRGIAISETAIEGNLMRDWYIALGEPLADNASLFRIHYKPWMRLVWLGGLMMAAGMFLRVLRGKHASS